MKTKFKVKITVDIAMTLALLLLMAYSLIGETAHEWIGIGMFVLFVLHHILNRKWLGAVPNGSYTPIRIMQTVLVGLIFLCMVGSMVSGIIISRYVFTFLPNHGGYELAGKLHMLCAYWGFVLMSIHLGFHWNAMLSAARKHFKPCKVREWLLRIVGYLFAGYGIVAFVRREIGSYMLLQSHFVFFDYSESVVFFLFDYLSVMALFVFFGYVQAWCLRKVARNSCTENP